jgi:putative phosphoesterase
MRTLGVIADTHGLLRPEAEAQLRGVDHIVHAGDIGSSAILTALRAIAPVTAVRGNNDKGAWARELPDAATLELGGRRIHVIHDVSTLTIDPRSGGVAVVIAGHSHKPSIVERDGVLYLNPGSAGPRRFSLPIAVATLRVGARALKAEIHELRVDAAQPHRR